MPFSTIPLTDSLSSRSKTVDPYLIDHFIHAPAPPPMIHYMSSPNRRPKQRPKQSLPPPFLYEDIRLSGRGFRIFRCSPIDEADRGANDFTSITTLGGAFGVPLADPEWLIRENKWCNIDFDLSRYHKPGASQVGFVPWMSLKRSDPSSFDEEPPMSVRAVEPQTSLTFKDVVWECIRVQKDYLEDWLRKVEDEEISITYMSPRSVKSFIDEIWASMYVIGVRQVYLRGGLWGWTAEVIIALEEDRVFEALE